MGRTRMPHQDAATHTHLQHWRLTAALLTPAACTIEHCTLDAHGKRSYSALYGMAYSPPSTLVTRRRLRRQTMDVGRGRRHPGALPRR